MTNRILFILTASIDVFKCGAAETLRLYQFLRKSIRSLSDYWRSEGSRYVVMKKSRAKYATSSPIEINRFLFH